MKKLLISLLVWFVWFVWFWYCDNVVTYPYYLPNTNVTSNSTKSFISWSCLLLSNWSLCWWWIYNNQDELIYTITASNNYSNLWQYCFDFDWYYRNTSNRTCEIIIIKDVYQECQECPGIDTNYCVENDLCPVASWSRSELVINNIVHEWRPLINLNIPDYITRDYTVDENQYDVYVWSWYDQDYIDSILKINSYRPDSQDFTQIFVSWLTLIFPYIFVALLIVFMWRLLKRIFK